MSLFSRSILSERSRDTRFLRTAAVLIVLACTLVAFIVGSVRTWEKVPNEQELNPDEELAVYLRRGLDQIRGRVTQWSKLPFSDHLNDLANEAQRDLFRHYIQAALKSSASESMAALQAAANEQPPTRFANQFLGDFASWENDMAGALQYYEKEAAFPEAMNAREQVVALLVRNKDHERLVRLIDEPRYQLNNHQSLLRLGVILKDPSLIMKGVILHDYRHVPLTVIPLTLLVACLWFIIILKICQVPAWHHPALYFGIAGFFLGVLSTTFTLFAVVWQEEIIGLALDGESLNDLIVYVCGVGVREEVIKLLFFLPLTPFLYRLRDPQVVLVAASCVGLGFAVQENLGYFGEQGSGAFGRFVTANFFHIALTGTLGFAFCRFLYSPKADWDHFLMTFIIVIIAHGVYDYFGAKDGYVFAIILFGWFCYHYFALVARHCSEKRLEISPLGVFVIGCALILGISIITLAFVQRHAFSFAIVGREFTFFFPLMFLFINQFRHA